jgi:hypothetical protein
MNGKDAISSGGVDAASSGVDASWSGRDVLAMTLFGGNVVEGLFSAYFVEGRDVGD